MLDRRKPTRRELDRRQFLSRSFFALAGGTLLSRFRPALAVANANSKSNSSDDKDTVTVVQFSDSGEKLGAAQVKKARKSDAD